METKTRATKFSKILILIIILLLAYIAYAKISANISEKIEVEKVESAKLGYQQAIIDIAQNVATCQQVPLIIGNQTINVVAVECLQEAPAE